MPRPVFHLLLALLLTLPHASGWAQTKPAPVPVPVPVIGAAQAKDALDILRDDTKRARLIGVLEAITKAEAVPAPASPPAPPAKPPVADASPLVPDSIGAELLVGLSGRLSVQLDRAAKGFAAATDFDLVFGWLSQVATNAELQGKLVDIGWRLIVVLALGLAAEYLLRRGLRRPIAAIEARAPTAIIRTPAPDADGLAAAEAGETEQIADTRRRQWLAALAVLGRRVPWALATALLDLVPLVLMLAISTAVLSTAIGGPVIARLVIQSAVDAYVVFRLASVGGNLLLAPHHPRLRPLPIGDAAAADLLRWIQRIAAIAIFGEAATKAGVFFNLYLTAQDALLKLVWLAVLVCCVAVVLQYRAAIAQLIRPAPDAHGLVAGVRRRLAGLWHGVAVLYLIALWLVSALDVANGFQWLLSGFFATAVILIGARVLIGLAFGLVDRALQSVAATVAEPGDTILPIARLHAYHPIARWIVQAVIGVLAALVLAQIWGIPVLKWFSPGSLGARLMSTLGAITLTLIVAVMLWEGINAAIIGHQERLSAGDKAARSARLRTLLPMLRTTLLIVIIIVVALISLSEIGVNIAPLLAGAGVVGLAIGFGSQKLVQDIITGIFLLLENAMQVGDSVTLAGLSGSVEALSIRTIRLRALDGAVHIVPFSAVTTVTNLTRDFGYAVIDVAVGLNEEPDRISTLLREIATELREDPKFSADIRADLEVLGVDKFLPNAWVMRARLRTLPGRHWAIGRELNLRIKRHFDTLKIESPITSQRALGIEANGLDAMVASYVRAQSDR